MYTTHKKYGFGSKGLYQLGSDLGEKGCHQRECQQYKNPVSTPRVHTRASTHRVGVTTRIKRPITLSRPSSEPMTTSHPGGEHTPGYTRARALGIRRTQETTETHTLKNSKDFDNRLLSQIFASLKPRSCQLLNQLTTSTYRTASRR